ncbi:MAG: hypothetical protein M3463_22995, partial [Verrucomicrobiota bacterium]|nr:hypothetical protein [Verrucomicrobiota bacterium]
MPRFLELGGKRLPFLRWSFVRMLVGMRGLMSNWQGWRWARGGAGEHVLANARPGDLDDAIRAVDEFCYGQSY